MLLRNKYSEIKEVILNSIPAEKIFLLATSIIDTRTESIFFKTSSQKQPSSYHYYLLVLISKKHGLIYEEVQEMIEETCLVNGSVKCSVLAMELEMFQEWRTAGHPFAQRVHHGAQRLYDAGVTATVATKTIGADYLYTIARANSIHYTKGLGTIQQLLDTGREKEAIVCGLQTIITTSTGIELRTKDTVKLLDYCRMVFKESHLLETLKIGKIIAVLRSLQLANAQRLRTVAQLV